MTGEPTHTASGMALRPQLSSEFVVSYVQRVVQRIESRTVRKAPLQYTHTASEMAPRTPIIF